MAPELAFEIAMAIVQNENRPIADLTDSQIGYYLADRNIDETPENVSAIRQA